MLITNIVLSSVPLISYLVLLVSATNPHFDGNLLEKECLDQTPDEQNLFNDPSKAAVLRHVLPGVCQYLNIRDSCTVQSVCSAFKDASRRDLLRRGPELKIIDVQARNQLNSDEIVDHQKSVISEILRVKPRIALVFVNHYMIDKPGFYESVAMNVFGKYIFELPENCMILNVVGSNVLMNSKPVTVSDNRALGLFIPENHGLKVRISGLRSNELIGEAEELSDAVANFFDSLQPYPQENTKNQPYGILIFDSASGLKKLGRHHLQSILNSVVSRFEDLENFALWGGQIHEMHGSSFVFPPYMSASVFALSISGPRVTCRSLVIDKRNSAKQIREKIEEFKKKLQIVKSKRTVALSMQHAYFRGSHMHLVGENKIFSDIFAGVDLLIFSTKMESIYCIDSGGQHSQVEYDQNHICYMVVVYL